MASVIGFCARVVKSLHIVSVDLPTFPFFTAEQFQLCTRTRRLNERVKLLRLARMFAAHGFDHRGMRPMYEHGPTAGGQKAMLGLAPKPFAGTHPVLNPGQ